MPRSRKYQTRRTRRLVRRRKRSSLNLVSAFIYSVAAVLCIALGAVFYSSYQRAVRKQIAARRSVERLLPPGRVVKRTAPAAGRTLTPRKPSPAAPPVARPPAPSPRPVPAVTEAVAGRLPYNLDPEGLQEPYNAAVPRAGIPGGGLGVTHAVTLPGRTGRLVWLIPPEAQKDAERLALEKDRNFWVLRFDVRRASGWDIRKAVFTARLLEGDAREVAFVPVPVELADPLIEGRLPRRRVKEVYLRLRNNPWMGISSTQARVVETDGTNRWLEARVDPLLVQALVAGQYSALAVFDEGGELAGGPLVLGSFSGGSPPRLKVEGHADDIIPPGPVSNLECRADTRLRRRRNVGVVLSWLATGDDGQKGSAFFYDVRYAPVPGSFADAFRLPGWETPPPREAGSVDGVVITGLEPETAYGFYVRAVDEVGVAGPVATVQFVTPPLMTFPRPEVVKSYTGGWILTPGISLALNVIPASEAFDPAGLPPIFGSRAARGSGESSPLWDRGGRTVHLRALQGETAYFTLLLAGRLRDMAARITPGSFSSGETHLAPQSVRLYRILCPPNRKSGSRFCDPLLPLSPGSTIGGAQDRALFAAQTVQGILCEVKVPRDQPPGIYRSQWEIRLGVRELSLLVFLDVRQGPPDDQTGFVVELCSQKDIGALYGAEGVEAVLGDYCRIARDHLCVFNPLPYSPDGTLRPGFAPELRGEGAATEISDWQDWDRRNGWMLAEVRSRFRRPLLLPLFENWPASLKAGFGCYDRLVRDPRTGLLVYGGEAARAASCLSNEYWSVWRSVARQMVRHFPASRGAEFHVWLINDPVRMYRDGPLPWFLGRPASRRDYAALEAFARSLDAGLQDTRQPVRFRVNVSRAEHLTDLGRGAFDIYCMWDPRIEAWELVRRRALMYGGEIWRILEKLPQGSSPGAARAVVLRTFLLGGRGLSILETCGGLRDWVAASAESVLYCGRALRRKGPVASLRLKLLHQGMQDVRLLAALQKRMGWTRRQLMDFASAWVNVELEPREWKTASMENLRSAVLELLRHSSGADPD